MKPTKLHDDWTYARNLLESFLIESGEDCYEDNDERDDEDKSD